MELDDIDWRLLDALQNDASLTNAALAERVGLSASQVLAAIRAQNVQFAAGSVGSDPAPEGQAFTATVSAEGRFNAEPSARRATRVIRMVTSSVAASPPK